MKKNIKKEKNQFLNNQNSKCQLNWYYNLSGIILCLIIAIPSWYLGKAFPLIGGPVFAILLGILITTLFPSITSKKFTSNIFFEPGIKFTSKKLLQYSIVLLGFNMNLFKVISVGKQSIFVMVFTLSGAFLTALIMGKFLHVSSNMTTLIGVGTSICGGSAIAATSPIISADDDDVTHAISTIFLFNIIAVLIFPALGHSMHMSDIGFGIWAGTAINDTSSVVAASASWNSTALAFATIVKLTRTLMIVPITLFIALYLRKKNKKNNTSFNFAKIFPWFIVFFLLAAIIFTTGIIPNKVSENLVSLGTFIIVMSMAAIGLNTNLKKLLHNGFKPLFLGLSCWFVVSIISLIVQHSIGLF